MGRGQEHKDFMATAAMEFSPVAVNEEAGPVVLRDRIAYLKFTMGTGTDGKVLRLFMRNGTSAPDTLLASSPVNANGIQLRMTAHGVNYSFSYSADGAHWEILAGKVDGRLLGHAGPGRIIGTFIGMYASSSGKAGENTADFDWFEYRPLPGPEERASSMF